MNIKAEGIIFRSFKYSETSLIVDVFTREQGLLSFIISGVRKKKSTISAAMLQVMNIVNIVAFNKNNQSLGRITEISNNYVHKELLYDFLKSAIGVFIIELSRNCIKEKEANYAIYDFMKQFLIYLDESNEGLGKLPLLYMVLLSKYLGFYPNNNYSDEYSSFDWMEGRFVSKSNQTINCMDITTSGYFSQLLQTSFEGLSSLHIPKVERKAMLESLLYYYQAHIESFKPLKSYKVLVEIMN